MSNGRGSKEERNKRFQKSKIERLILNRDTKPSDKDLSKILEESGKKLQETLTKSGKNMGDLFRELEIGTKESKENGAGFKDALGERPGILQQLSRDRIQPPKQRPFRDDGTKPVLDSKGNIVKNLRQKAMRGGQFQEVDVIDLTTEMVIDE